MRRWSLSTSICKTDVRLTQRHRSRGLIKPRICGVESDANQDALVLVLLVVDEPRFARASSRWLGRLCLEVPALTLRQLLVIASALAGFLIAWPRSRFRAAAPSLG